MLKIRLNESGFLELRSYTPSFIKLISKSQREDNSTVLGSKTLTAAFIKKYELDHVVSELMAGTTIVVPSIIAFRAEALKELRQFRYDNLTELPDFKSFKVSKKSNKTLVSLEFGVVSLELYETSLLQKRVKKLLGELRLETWFRFDNHYYFKKGTLSSTAQSMWGHRFREIGLNVNFKEVDENLEVVVFTMKEINNNLITKEVSIEDHFGF